jgi:RNA polymerase sigma factor (sigma-70 family)
LEDLAKKIKQIRKGNKDALIHLILERKNEYYKLAYVYLGNEEDAMDALEDMIVILYENIKNLRNPESFYSWSKKILVNCCKQILKKRNKIIPTEETPEQIYVERYEQKEQKADLEKCLALLSSEQQETIRLRYFLDLDYNTIAQVLDIPVGTVKSRISIGLKRLKTLCGGEDDE